MAIDVGDLAHGLLLSGLRGLVGRLPGFSKLDGELDPVGIVDRHRLAVLAAATGRQHERSGFGQRHGGVVHQLPSRIDTGSPVGPGKRAGRRLGGRSLLDRRGGIMALHVEDQVRAGEQDAAHHLGHVSGRREARRSRRGDRRRGRACDRRESDLLQRGFVRAELGLSGRESCRPGACTPRDRPTAAGQLARIVCGHRVLDLVEQVRHRSAPHQDEVIAGERGSLRAAKRRAVAVRAPVLVHRLTTRGLRSTCTRRRSPDAPAAPVTTRKTTRRTPRRTRPRPPRTTRTRWRFLPRVACGARIG